MGLRTLMLACPSFLFFPFCELLTWVDFEIISYLCTYQTQNMCQMNDGLRIIHSKMR